MMEGNILRRSQRQQSLTERWLWSPIFFGTMTIISFVSLGELSWGKNLSCRAIFIIISTNYKHPLCPSALLGPLIIRQLQVEDKLRMFTGLLDRWSCKLPLKDQYLELLPPLQYSELARVPRLNLVLYIIPRPSVAVSAQRFLPGVFGFSALKVCIWPAL